MAATRLTPEERREQTRSALLDAAADVFARRGFHAASLDEVADAAGFSKGAVYSNFTSKDDLFQSLIEDRGRKLVAEFADAAVRGEQDASSLIERLSDVYLRRKADENDWALWMEFTLYALRKPELRRRLIEEGRQTHRMVVDIVEQHAGQAHVEPPIPAAHIAYIYAALFTGLWQMGAVDPDSLPDEMFAEAVVFVRQAIETLGKPRKKKR
jgi:AcrR family transcriptional regulator